MSRVLRATPHPLRPPCWPRGGTTHARRNLLVAAALELVIGLCAFVHWFVPGSPL